MTAVKISKLTYTFPDGTKALKGISLAIPANRKTAIVGCNGSGKTTLLYHLNGVFLPQSGQVSILGEILDKEKLPGIRRKVGFIFDNPDNQLFSTTVYNDVAFGPRNLKLNPGEIEERVTRSLHMVGAESLKNKPPYHLSLGQKKKVAIAGVLAMEPDIIVCDEPFSGLDLLATQNILDIFNDLARNGLTLIFSSHDVNLVYAWAEEVIIIKEGQVLAQGAADILENEKLMAEAQLRMPLMAFLKRGHKPHELKGIF